MVVKKSDKKTPLPFGLSATGGAKQVELFANTLGVWLGCGWEGHLGFGSESNVGGLVTMDLHFCGGENSVQGEQGMKTVSQPPMDRPGVPDSRRKSKYPDQTRKWKTWLMWSCLNIMSFYTSSHSYCKKKTTTGNWSDWGGRWRQSTKYH